VKSCSQVCFVALVLALVTLPDAHAEVRTRVYINGVPTTVYFNDGDSFRVLEGEYANRGCRLGGFNTLESFGPTHAWGSWHPFELWINAKQATLNGRRGIWHCTTDGSLDGYGRLLLDCPDLAVDQIRKGLAHAYNIDDNPSRPEYLRAQQEAIRNRRGMWAHGVPGFVLTSLHSASEDPTRDSHYNRMVSSRDGHTERWEHHDTYPECSWQCATEIVADAEQVEDVARSLRENPATRSAVAEVPNLLLIELVDRFARLQQLPEYTDEAVAEVVRPVLEQAMASGELDRGEEQLGSCMNYTEFRRRYGRERASCLRDRGTPVPQLQEASP